MFDWARSYASHWRVFRVNPSTWADGEPLNGVDSLDAVRDSSGEAPLIDSGTVRVTGEPPERGWYRFVMTAEQDGTIERVDAITLELSGTGGAHDHGIDTTEMIGRSTLYPASVYRLEPGQYAPAGSDGAEYAARLLRLNCVAPVVVHGGFRLASNVVPERGVEALELAWQVVRAGGYIIQIAGNGTIHILPEPTEPALLLDRAAASLLLPKISYKDDYADVPNRYKVTEGDSWAVAENVDPTSAVGLPNVGYWVDAEPDDNPVRIGGETLHAYARRRLMELSTITSERTYTRKWWPGVLPGDVVQGSMASVHLEGNLRVVRQSLACGAGIAVTEMATREVKLWQG